MQCVTLYTQIAENAAHLQVTWQALCMLPSCSIMPRARHPDGVRSADVAVRTTAYFSIICACLGAILPSNITRSLTRPLTHSLTQCC